MLRRDISTSDRVRGLVLHQLRASIREGDGILLLDLPNS
jgi:hypothetical protein